MMNMDLKNSESLMIGVLISTVLCLFGFLMVMRKKKNRGEVIKDGEFFVPKGSWGWPLIGETIEFIASGYSSNPVSFMENRRSLYGDVFRTHILGKPIIVSTDPDVNKMILQNHGNIFVPSYPQSIMELMGKSSIFVMNGSMHKRLHSLVGVFFKSPDFKSRITRVIENSVKISLSTWANKTPRVYFQHEAKKITFEILVQVLTSLEPGEEMDLLKKEFEEYIKGLICIPIKFPGTRLYKSLQARERLIKIIDTIVDERKIALEKDEEKAPANDVIDALLHEVDGSENGFKLDFISGNIVEFMVPGEESVPTATTLAVKFLTDNPTALAQMVEENMELKKRKEQSCEECSWTDYLSLPFTQNVISETLRLANIINAVWRKALKDVKVKGYLIPKGWCVLASFSSVHMDESNYENPYKFDPWRWEKIGSLASGHTFTPFGGGQRLCPGFELARLEISIFLHHFVTTYRWVADKDDIIYFPTVRMKKKLPITITPIHN